MKHSTWTEFKADLGASLKAWRVAPLLPLISVGLALTPHIPQPWWWLALPVLLLAIGWLGSERIWYLRIFRDEAISSRELWRMTRAFFGRFVRLGLVAAVAFVPVMVVGLPRLLDEPENTDVLANGPPFVAMAVAMFVVYFALTFVTPALSFSTRRVRSALRLGFRMLREHWPRTAWYAFVPALVVLVTFRVSGSASFGVPGQIALSAVAALFNVWFKGATVAFYLRRVEVSSEGAAFVPDERAYESSAASGPL